MEQITCDLIPGGKMPLLHASQYDEGREYRISLTENKQAYTLDGTELLTVSVRKGDNTLFSADISNTFGGKSYVDFVSTEQMCAVAGYNYGELTIEKNNTRIGTVNFMLVCEPSPEASGLTSESEINNLNRQIDDHIDEILPEMLDDDVPPVVDRVIDETLAPVAKSGNYNDLDNKPTIPAPQVNSDWNANSGISQILNKPNLATVATSGDYNDLLNKPSVAVIDDTEASASKVYSSNKVKTIANTKADKATTYTKAQTNDLIDEINEGQRIYTKAQALNSFEKAESGANVILNVGKNKFGLNPIFANAVDSYTLIIPCVGIKTIKFPMFKSSSSFGSGFLGARGELINGHANNTDDTGTYRTEIVPINAEVFLFSVSGDLASLDWSLIISNNASVIKSQDILEDTVINNKIENITPNNYYTTSGDTFGWGMTYTVQDYGCVYDKCVPGDIYLLTGAGGQSPRLWAFVDSNNNIISKASASASETNLILTVPLGAAYAVFNVHVNQTWSIYKGLSLEQRIDEKIKTASSSYVAKNQGVAKSGQFLFVDENGLVSTTEGESGNSSSIYDGYLLKLAGSEAVPVGESALSYADFISQTWDMLLSAFPNEVTKTTIINDSSNTYPIYKYVFAPAYYKKTVLLTAGMHGDEYEGFWGLFRLLKLIYTEGYKYPNLRKIRHDVRFIIIPVLNPYGVQNKSRYNSQGIDANQNYDVYWDDPNYTHSGSSPFSANESKAVKIVADEYSGEINYAADFHTDTYSPSKGLYIEADGNSPTYEAAYGLTLDFRQILKDEYNYGAPLSQNFVIWENNACAFFRYMEVVQQVPANIVEVGVGGFSTTGSADTMKTGVEWYGNVVANLVVKGLIVEGE